MKIEIDVPTQRIADMMVGAIEGGSGYWCSGVRLQGDTSNWEKPWYSDPKLYESQFEISVVEDSGDEKIHIIRPADLTAGLKMMAEKHGRHFGDMINETDDAITADVFLQCVALKDVVYG